MLVGVENKVFAGKQLRRHEAATLSHLEEEDQRADGQVWTVGDRPLQRSLPDHVSDRDHAGQEHAVEEGCHGVRPPHQQADEHCELDVSKTHRLGLEDERADQGDEREEEAGTEASRKAGPPRVVEDARGQGEPHRREDHTVEDEPVLEVKKDHLHQDQAEHAVQQQQPRRAELVAEGGQDQRRRDHRPPNLPGLGARLEALQLREPDRAPAHQPAGRRSDDCRPDGDERVTQIRTLTQCGRVWRMTASGAGLPVQISKERAPCARRIPHPSATRSPSERALRTRGVPPRTYTRSMTAPPRGRALGRRGISSRRPKGVAFSRRSADRADRGHDGSVHATTRPGRSTSSGRLATKVRCAPSRAMAAARADPPAPRITTLAPWASSPMSAIADRMPATSVFDPVSRAPSLAMVLTAPARTASGSMVSRWSITARLYGIVTLAPPVSGDRSPRMASGNSAGGTSSSS